MTRFCSQNFWRCCVVVAALLLAHSALARTVVVAGAGSAVNTLDPGQVRDLFLGNLSFLPDGSSVILVDQPASSPLRNDFYLKVTNKSAAQARAQWAKLYFTGRGIPPHEGLNSEDIKKYLNANPGSIGYIDEAAIDGSVKVIYVVK
jgi:hypothetical protein